AHPTRRHVRQPRGDRTPAPERPPRPEQRRHHRYHALAIDKAIAPGMTLFSLGGTGLRPVLFLLLPLREKVVAQRPDEGSAAQPLPGSPEDTNRPLIRPHAES